MSLILLDEMENKTKIPISKLFDYFVGVSAGAVICSFLLGLAQCLTRLKGLTFITYFMTPGAY